MSQTRRAYRVLAEWQPFATLLVAPDPIQARPRPAKAIESRSFNPRGELPIDVVIHATKKMDGEVIPLLSRWPYAQCLERCGYYPGDPRPFTTRRIDPPRRLKPLPVGALVGVATVVRVERSEDVWARLHAVGDDADVLRGSEELALGDYTGGKRFGWHMANQVEFPEPIPFTGRQDVLYYLDPELNDRVLEQLARAEALGGVR